MEPIQTRVEQQGSNNTIFPRLVNIDRRIYRLTFITIASTLWLKAPKNGKGLPKKQHSVH